eukprot:8145418-Ditylum_brightwellii.AAC.1
MSWSVTSKDTGVKIDTDRQSHTDGLVEVEISLKYINSNRSSNTIIPMQEQDVDNECILRQDKEEEKKDKVKDGEDESNAAVPHLLSTMQTHNNTDSNCGPATLYTIKEENRNVLIPVFFAEHYEYHGKALQILNYQEY